MFLFIFLCFVSTSLSAQGWHHLGKVDRVEKQPDGVDLTSGNAKVRITFCATELPSVAWRQMEHFPKDQSWAIVEEMKPPAVTVKDSGHVVTVSAGDVIVTIRKATLLVNFSDTRGNLVVADEPSLADGVGWRTHPSVEENASCRKITMDLGDKPWALNRRNRAFTMWNTDAYGLQESTDPIYKTIPFFLGIL